MGKERQEVWIVVRVKVGGLLFTYICPSGYEPGSESWQHAFQVFAWPLESMQGRRLP